MALPKAYLTSTKNLGAVLEAAQNAQAPERFTQKFLEDLGFTSSADRLVIGMLKSLEFIGDTGTPLKRYHEYLDKTESKKVMAKAIREAYADLFQINKNAQTLTKAEAQSKMKTLSQGQYSDDILSKMATTFKALCGLADFDAPTDKDASDDSGDDPGSEDDGKGVDQPSGSKLTMSGLHYNINIHLPESRDPAVYDALFRSLNGASGVNGEMYNFVYRALLTEEALDRAGRHKAVGYGDEEALRMALNYDLLDQEDLAAGLRMANIYAAITAFERSARTFVEKVLQQAHGDNWWDTKVSDKIRTFAEDRREEEDKVKWHGTRGDEPLTYTQMDHLTKIMQQNWPDFEPFVRRIDWMNSIFSNIERSRNVIMHSGVLDDADVERVGMNIRDWIRQVG
ncbi:DUF5343 domain-containing protein [Tsukamurella pseudospumae]|uniref:DUF5343 domain-containing protein n=1 Tax=Tsukamurella pseudospumae TaxID=239498 RepID=UPI000ADDD3DE|nr:DUF5343 domain-containing protein [Tsukamurella pseudospumae]